MPDYQTVARTDDIPEGEGRAFPVEGRMVAVFRQNDTYYAINDTCPHMGASLAEGYLEGTAVHCPWHAWRFCVTDGTWLDNPKAQLRTDSFPVRVQDGEIQVQLPDVPGIPDDAAEESAAADDTSDDVTSGA